MLESSGYTSRPMPSQNVIGVLEGTDPVLKNEYVLLTAHYDHVGTGKDGGGQFTPQDSIFTGTRDNAMGTAALIAAAKFFFRCASSALSSFWPSRAKNRPAGQPVLR